MMPNVATHILHHTSRAVAAVQNQTSHTIRNVLQLQSSPGSSTTPSSLNTWNGAGSSSWGSNGAGPGGAKFNAGSRYHTGYAGAGRAVTQASSVTSHDNHAVQTDDKDELVPAHIATLQLTKKPRLRSQSLSLSVRGRHERGQKLGVLRTVQLHARSRHAFAAPPLSDQLPDGRNNGKVAPLPRSSSRHNTTVSIGTLSPVGDLPPSLLSPSVSPISSHELARKSSQFAEESDGQPSSIYLAIQDAIQRKDAAGVIRQVSRLRSEHTQPLIYDFNIALQALYETRVAGEPLALLLETYNDMVSRSILPNYATYRTMILALTDRDHEIHKHILLLQNRIKRRTMFTETSSVDVYKNRINQLKTENNFSSAMALFEAANVAGKGSRLPLYMYHNLLRSCAYHANVDAAIHVFARLEQRQDIYPSAMAYAHLMSAYVKVDDLHGAKEVFDEFRRASQAQRISWTKYEEKAVQPDKAVTRADITRSQLSVWNNMIEAYLHCGEPGEAVRLLEEMMDAPVDSGDAPTGSVHGAPPPSSSTFAIVITGFCQSGDISTALSWFDNLLLQSDAPRQLFEPSSVPSRPDQTAWTVMLENLAQARMIKDLNRLFPVLVANAVRDGLAVRPTDRILLFEANMWELENNDNISDSAAIESLDFIATHVVEQIFVADMPVIYRRESRRILEKLYTQYSVRGLSSRGFELVERFVEHALSGERGVEESKDNFGNAQQLMLTVSLAALQHARKSSSSFADTLRIFRLFDRLHMPSSPSTAPFLLNAYAVCKERGELAHHALNSVDYRMLAEAAIVTYGVGNDFDLPSFLLDLSTMNVDVLRFGGKIIGRLASLLESCLDPQAREQLLAQMNPQCRSLFKQRFESPPITQSYNESTLPARRIAVHGPFSRYVDEYSSHPNTNALDAFTRLQTGFSEGKYAHPSTIGRLISALGRIGEIDKVRELYNIAQVVLGSLDEQKHWQSYGWFQVEDHMIIACAHSGDLDAAFTHRNRIIENGGVPTADAYGTLIECVKDTTDDTSNAMALFHEAQTVGCTPNVYLYNTIISKLAKARKADHALELFRQMKTVVGLSPTSITYGAVIAACARVGDAQSAEQLFLEMSSQPNFKPRIPPYNTMMQLYTHTKPDRPRVLHYFDALIAAQIKPSAHTYKLLIDAYGTIEPVDIMAMERVFKMIESSKSVYLQGSHWASLINAWGCVQKDLDKAIAVFESIPNHTSTRRSQMPLPDAVTYESLINVLVTHRRMDLVSSYIDRLKASSVHLTAYIANLLIKGHATAGDMDRARSIFESLADPPRGMAAPNNHVPHEISTPTTASGSLTCYREPSTWEAMFRAELGSGNRERAIALLDRLQERQFPSAVYNRIRGVMLDDSVSPWPSPS